MELQRIFWSTTIMTSHRSIEVVTWLSPSFSWLSVWLSFTANVPTSVSSLCSDVGLQCATTHFRDDKDSWLCFPPLSESNVTIRIQHWQTTCPKAYVAFSLFKKPEGSSVAFLENFNSIIATFVASGSDESSTFNWCLFWVLEAAGMAGRQLESYKNGSSKLHFSFFSALSESAHQSFQLPRRNIAIDSDHIFSSKMRTIRCCKYSSCSYTNNSLSPV